MAFRSSRAEAAIAALLAVALVAGILLWLYFPVIPRSTVGWALLFVAGIPTWFFLEWLGGRVLASSIFSRLRPAARIALAVPVLLVLLLVAACIIHLGQGAISGS